MLSLDCEKKLGSAFEVKDDCKRIYYTTSPIKFLVLGKTGARMFKKMSKVK